MMSDLAVSLMPTPQTPLWLKPLLSLGVLFLILIGVEVGLRLTGHCDAGSYFGEGSSEEYFLKISENEDVAYELAPSTSGHARGCDVLVNSLGLRDREYPMEKPPGTYRILTVGDSVTFGYGVAVEESYPKQLEEMLSEYGVEVINLGLGGYDTINEAARLESLGVGLQPDLVLVGYCLNDITVWSPNLNLIRRKSERATSGRELCILEFVRDRLQDPRERGGSVRSSEMEEFRFRFSNRIAGIREGSETAQTMLALETLMAAWEREIRYGGERFFRHYLRRPKVGRVRYGFDWLARLGREHGFDVVLVPLPYYTPEEVAAERELVDRIIETEARGVGLEWLGLDRDRDWKPLLMDDGMHPNAQGHGVLAEEISRELVKRGDWPAKTR